MCGFAGILTTTGPDSEELAGNARRMIAPLTHRGPDDSGVWADAGAGIAFGFRRLAILDLSPHGHQPMSSPSGRFVIVFNGELYNFKEIRRELEQHGFRFRGHSDTEVILAAFERWGIREAVVRFVGMFAIAVWDAQRRELSLVRDRLGKKPLYVYREPGLITFGSELKALVAGPSFDRSIDRAAIGAYLRYLYVPAPMSIFQHAIKLLPAHILTVADPALPLPAPAPYWSLREVALRGVMHPLTATDAEAIDQLEALLVEVVGCRLHSDVPLGALLSGGIDSSTIVALMQEGSSRPVKTYAIGFRDEEFNEAPHAARVARYLGTDHTELMLTGEDAQSLVPRLPDIFDEPLADPSQLPTILVSQLARQHVTVALSGDGGDELFGGYNRYVYGTRMLPRMNRVPAMVRRGVAAGLGSIPPTAWDRLSQFTAPLFPTGRVGERVHKVSNLMRGDSVGDMYRSLLSAWQEPDDLVVDSRASEDQNRQILDGSEPTDLLDRMMLADQMAYLPGRSAGETRPSEHGRQPGGTRVRSSITGSWSSRGDCHPRSSCEATSANGCCVRCSTAVYRNPSSNVPRWGSQCPSIDGCEGRCGRGPRAFCHTGAGQGRTPGPGAHHARLDGPAGGPTTRRPGLVGRRHVASLEGALGEMTHPPRLLFLCQTLPYPPDGGVWIRTYHVLRLLARAFDITALCFERQGSAGVGAEWQSAASDGALGRFADVEVFAIPQKHSRLRFVWDHLRSTASGRVYTTYL